MTVRFAGKAPFPWFGGKRHAASHVWAALGDVSHYSEPFGGSLAVMLLRPHPVNRANFSETTNDLDGLLCLSPEARILHADLTWRPIGEARPGDPILAFDESNPGTSQGFGAPHGYRKFRLAEVTATRRVTKPAYRLTFDDGTTVVASADHQWLAGSHVPGHKGGRGWRWMSTSSMVANRTNQRSWVMKVCDVATQIDSYEAGWLAGFLDGEGHVRTKSSGWQVTATQRIGPESDRAKEALIAYKASVQLREPRSERHSPQENHVVHGKRNVLRLLMETRPERLIRDLVGSIDGRLSLYGREHEAVGLVAKEYVGEVEVVALETTTGTYIAEGLASHNCNFWRSIQFFPNETAEAASWPVIEADLMARHIALVNWCDDAMVEKLRADPAFCDPQMAGWWVWGQSSWIGSGWCTGKGPWRVDRMTGRVVRTSGKDPGPGVTSVLPFMGDGRGVTRPDLREPSVTSCLPFMGSGQGVNHPGLRELGVGDEGWQPMTMPDLLEWFGYLSARLRHVRILQGSWERAVTESALKTMHVRSGNGHAGVFLDPPYSNDVRVGDIYAHDSGDVADDVRAWCLEHGEDPKLRIVLAGFDTEHVELEDHGWRVIEWFKDGFFRGGMGNTNRSGVSHQMDRDRLWLSPACLDVSTDKAEQQTLFDF